MTANNPAILDFITRFDQVLNELVDAHHEAAEQSPLPESVYVASCKLFYLFRRLERLIEEANTQ